MMCAEGAVKVPVHFEVYVKPTSHCDENLSAIEGAVLDYISTCKFYTEGLLLSQDAMTDDETSALRQHVDELIVTDIGCGATVDRQDTAHFVHLSCLQDEVPIDECLELGEEIIPAIKMHALPSRELHGMWDSLLFDTDVKSQLLQYAQTAMLFADRSVDQSLVTFNRLLLLHGPPGTGKTSLCKALGQKLAVRLAHRYDSGCLLEINSHSLFSRWFSESGKLVQQLFGRIEELAADAKTLCVVLIDEVESLSAARNASGSEPSDALRVVNAMLTQLDQLKRLPNVLMLTTSNITAAIDAAFLDRADLKLYIGNPSLSGRYEILRSAVAELLRVRLVELPAGVQLLSARTCEQASRQHPGGRDLDTQASMQLYRAAAECAELSGRTLRKLPFLAFAQHCVNGANPQQFAAYVESLQRAAAHEQRCRAQLQSSDTRA